MNFSHRPKIFAKFLDESRAALNANPEDLNATARIFYYYQQQGKLDAAQQAITNFATAQGSGEIRLDAQELLHLRAAAGGHPRLS